MKVTGIKRSTDDRRVDFFVDGYQYHTNKDGYGLWIGDDYTKQIAGTVQFSLRQDTKSGMWKAIRKYFER